MNLINKIKPEVQERRKADRRKADHRNLVLSHCIQASLKNYFEDLDGHEPGNLYDLVLNEIEKPLLEVVMQQTGNNITKAAEVLGLNRGTLRKKIQKYGISKAG